jgi:hypothetical protein
MRFADLLRALLAGFAGTVLTITSNPSFAGSEVRGGGDGIYCHSDEINHLNGLYSLDYVLGLPMVTADNKFADIASLEQSFARIQKNLNAVFPELAAEFAAYVRLTKNRTQVSERRIWLGQESLVEIADEDFIGEVPRNCWKEHSEEPAKVQMVVRSQDLSTGFIRYYFDIKHLAALTNQGALQLSMLYVHEWLWDFFKPASINQSRLLNFILHTEQFDGMTAEQFRKTLQNLDFDFTAVGHLVGSDQANVGVGRNFSCATKNGTLACWGYLGQMTDRTGKFFATKDPGVVQFLPVRNFMCYRTLETIDCLVSSKERENDFYKRMRLAVKNVRPTAASSSEGSLCFLGADGLNHCVGSITGAVTNLPMQSPVVNSELAVAFQRDDRIFRRTASGDHLVFDGIKSDQPALLSIHEETVCALFNDLLQCKDQYGNLVVKRDRVQATQLVASEAVVCTWDHRASGAWGKVTCDKKGYMGDDSWIKDLENLTRVSQLSLQGHACWTDAKMGIHCTGPSNISGQLDVPQGVFP